MSRLFIKRLCLAGLLLIGLCALFFLGWSRVDVPAAVAPPEQAENGAPDETADAAQNAEKEHVQTAWHAQLEEKLPGLLGREHEKYAVFAFYPNRDSQPFSYQSRPMRSASMIKVFILEKAMSDVEHQTLSLDETLTLHGSDKVGGAGVFSGWPNGSAIPVRQVLTLMITESDNTATNLMIDRLGMDAINTYIGNHGYSDTRLARKMMDTEAMQAGRENMTSVNDLGRYFTRLWRQEDMSPASRPFMLDCLFGQTDRECFPAAFPEARIAHKTGELDGLYDDGGIILRHDEPLILCIMDDDIFSRYLTIRTMKEIAKTIGAVYAQ
jgi:beta-lactamase class A